MADDDGGDWFADAGDDPVPDPTPAATAAAGGAGDAPPAAGEEGAPADGQSAEEKKDEEAEYLDPDKLLLFKHWIRPKFLQYKYLYDYRRNYYNDVIDYLDKRQKGLYRDIPHPQTWAERVLRTYTDKINRRETLKRLVDDVKLVTKTRISGAFHIYHSKSYINRRYSSILV